MLYIPAIISFVAIIVLSPVLISILNHLKLTQPIRKELPKNHQKKKGTPLMLGGIFLIGVIIAFLFKPDKLMFFLSSTFILFSIIGFADDFRKASRQDPKGISGRTKLFFQFVFTVSLLIYLIYSYGLNTDISIYKSLSLGLTVPIYMVVMTLFVVGSANAINFTDGLDGLLGIVAIPTYFFFFLISDKLEVRIFCISMIGCILGFLLYNLFPAKGFMGDTGSLAIGGSLSFLAVIEKVEILIPLLFFVYFAEQISVIMQVLSFKLTGKRLFKMTPIHFHFGLKYEWSENKTVLIFGIISWICAIGSWLYKKIFLL